MGLTLKTKGKKPFLSPRHEFPSLLEQDRPVHSPLFSSSLDISATRPVLGAYMSHVRHYADAHSQLEKVKRVDKWLLVLGVNAARNFFMGLTRRKKQQEYMFVNLLDVKK